jgi:hypothetical protein
LLDPSVGQVHRQRGFDLGSRLGDPAGDFHEWLEAGSSGAFQPCVEQRERVFD